MDIEVNIDDRAWESALDAMMVRIADATGEASLAAARAIKTITQAELLERSHGELTWSPAPAGSPPAAVSGALAESIDTAMSGPMSAIVGPTGLDYARIHELGGYMHGDPYMIFHKFTGSSIAKFKLTFVDMYKWQRPYLRPATETATDSGRGGIVRDIYVSFWSGAIEG